MRDCGFIRPEFELRYLVAERIADVLPMIETALARQDRTGARVETIDPRL
jgi:hypothetical protein